MAVRPGYKQTEVGVIPEDWEVTTVGDEFSIQLGKMLDVEKNIGAPKLYLGNRHVQWGRIELNDLGIIKMTPADCQRFRLRKGDLLVCEGGEIGRAAIWNEPIEECYFQKALHRLRSMRGYNVRFMLNVLEWLASLGVLNNFVTQTSIAHLPKDKLETVPIPRPPKAEQQAIAEALSDVDGLISALDALIAKKRALKGGAMQELLTGQRRLPGFARDWEFRTLDSLGRRGRPAIKAGPFGSSLTKDKYVAEGYKVYGQEQVIRGDYLYGDYFIPKALFEELKSCAVEAGDILLSLVGTAGRVLVIPNGAPEGIINPRLIRFSFDQSVISSQFFQYLFETETYQTLLERSAQGGTMGVLNATLLRPIAIPVPSLSEQTAIAQILADMDAELAALAQKRAKTVALKQGMMQALLTGQVRLG